MGLVCSFFSSVLLGETSCLQDFLFSPSCRNFFGGGLREGDDRKRTYSIPRGTMNRFSPQSLIPAYSMQNRYFIGHCNVYFSLNQSRKAGEG